MRTLLSLVVLVAGLAVLGFWAMVDAAPAIEAKIARDALALVDGKARHGMDISVSGRDITLSGLAHTKDERRKFLDRLNSVIGVRMVIDRSDVLAAARPYVFDIHKDGDVLRAKGFVPDAASEDSLRAIFPDGTDLEISVASGEPNADWLPAVISAKEALDVLKSGRVSIIQRDILITGMVESRDIAVNAEAIGNAIPIGYSWSSDIRIALPAPKVIIEIDAFDGIKTSGAVPGNMDIDALRQALGAAEISGNFDEAKGEDIDALLAALKGIAPHLTAFDTAEVTATADGLKIEAAVLPDVDLDLLTTALNPAVTSPDALTLAPSTRQFSEGMARVNPVTGVKEIFSGTYWLPEIDFTTPPETCAADIAAIATPGSIGFAGDDARLDLASRSTINRLFATVIRCLVVDGAQVQIVAAGAEPLAQTRADAIAAALIKRGVPKDRVIAKGAPFENDGRDVIVTWQADPAPEAGEE